MKKWQLHLLYSASIHRKHLNQWKNSTPWTVGFDLQSFCTRPWAPSIWTFPRNSPVSHSTLCFHTHLSVNSLIKLIRVIEINDKKKKIDHSAGSHRGCSVFPEKHRQLVSRWRKPPVDWWPKHYLGSLSNFVILELNLGVVFSQSSANPIRQVLTVRGRRQKKREGTPGKYLIKGRDYLFVLFIV